MEQRPKIKIKLSLLDKIIEVTSYVVLVALWVMIFCAFSSLPETIPVHYNGSGEVDGYGSKATIFFHL